MFHNAHDAHYKIAQHYTILSQAIIPYLHYGLLMGINFPNFESKNGGNWNATTQTACRNTICCTCIFEAVIFHSTKAIELFSHDGTAGAGSNS